LTNFAPLGCKCKVGRLTSPNREVFSFYFSAINLCQTMLNIYKFLFRLKINAKNFIIIDSLISWFNYFLISIALLNYWFVDSLSLNHWFIDWLTDWLIYLVLITLIMCSVFILFYNTFIIDKFIFILQEDISLVLLQPINAIQGLYFGEMHPGKENRKYLLYN